MNKREESFLLNLLQSVKDDNYEFLAYDPTEQKDNLGNPLFTQEQTINFNAYLQSLCDEGFLRHFNGNKSFTDIIGNAYFVLTPKAIGYFEEKMSAATTNSEDKYDVFLSHANSDKLNYVDDLYQCLEMLGIRIFYDKKVIGWGDYWKKSILSGTQKSEFAIIVISENFFDREWTERELTEFMKRQNVSGQKIVLPILYNITIDELKEKYPYLADIQVIEAKDVSNEEVAILFAKELIQRYKNK